MTRFVFLKNFLMIVISILALTACKKEKPPEEAKAQPAKPVIQIEDLAAQSLKNKEDWTKDLEIYIDDVLTCANAAPVQTKYVFRADAFETPPIALVLLKGENDKIYACSLQADTPKPQFKQVALTPPDKSPRFYPGDLPKADSCLLNTRILDKSGRTAGWLSKITC